MSWESQQQTRSYQLKSQTLERWAPYLFASSYFWAFEHNGNSYVSNDSSNQKHIGSSEDSKMDMLEQIRVEPGFTLVRSLREAAGRILMWELAKPKPKAHSTKILRTGITANCYKVPADSSNLRRCNILSNMLTTPFNSIGCPKTPYSIHAWIILLPPDVHWAPPAEPPYTRNK